MEKLNLEISCCPVCHGKNLVQEWDTEPPFNPTEPSLKFKSGRCHCGDCGVMIARDVLEMAKGKKVTNYLREGKE